MTALRVGRVTWLVAACFAVGCGSSPTAPTQINQPQAAPPALTTADLPAPLPAPPPTVEATSTGILITGPRGTAPECLAAAQLPAVLEWRITNVPLNARIDKAYNHDDTKGCAFTEQHLRTQNDHLRIERDPFDPTTLIVRFDKNTYVCGRTQVDISIDGGNILGEVLNYGADCTPPPDCGTAASTFTPSFVIVPLGPTQVRVDVTVLHRNVTRVVTLHWKGADGREWDKGSWPVSSPCATTVRQEVFSWVSSDPAHLPSNGAIYSLR